jgi:hypothetical protein
MGGECTPNGGRWEVGITKVALTDLGQRIFGVPTLVLQSPHPQVLLLAANSENL